MEVDIYAMGVVRSSVISGFWLRVDWLFAEKLPDENAVVEAILAGDPANTA